MSEGKVGGNSVELRREEIEREDNAGRHGENCKVGKKKACCIHYPKRRESDDNLEAGINKIGTEHTDKENRYFPRCKCQFAGYKNYDRCEDDY